MDTVQPLQFCHFALDFTLHFLQFSFQLFFCSFVLFLFPGVFLSLPADDLKLLLLFTHKFLQSLIFLELSGKGLFELDSLIFGIFAESFQFLYFFLAIADDLVLFLPLLPQFPQIVGLLVIGSDNLTR